MLVMSLTYRFNDLSHENDMAMDKLLWKKEGEIPAGHFKLFYINYVQVMLFLFACSKFEGIVCSETAIAQSIDGYTERNNSSN